VHPVPASPAVGFDLDMTLADPRQGVVASWRALSERTGVYIDADAVAGRLGPPVEVEVERWFPTKDVPAVTDLYRKLHQEHGVPATFLMPGALAACEAVVAAGSRVVVVTAKKPELAAAVVMRLGLPAEAVHGGLWGGAKGPCLREEGAVVYVGDHPQDVAAARVADAFSVGVETGPEYPAAADVVLPSLLDFPDWYAAWLDNKP
jgi:phosphoglycolate phosphatase